MATPRTRMYRGGRLADQDFPVTDIHRLLREADTTVWVDYLSPTEAEFREIAGELDLHELAVEDALGPHQRPKTDIYDTHLFLSCRWIRLDQAEGVLEESEVDVFANHRWVITVRPDDRVPLDQVERRFTRSPELAAKGASFILYALLDVVVDGYFDVTQVFDEYYDEVSEGIFLEHPLGPTQQRKWFEMRRALVRFHRLVVPMREAVSSLMRRDESIVTSDLYPYYQDVYDHVLRVSEATDSLRELVSTIVDTNISLRDYRQNQIMKKVTSWAAIAAVPTLITGFYGMNVPFAGFGQRSGVITAVVLMLCLSVGLFWQFRRRDWI